MILEMRRALEELGKGEHQGYRKLYDATYEEVYCRNLLILQNEKQAVDFMESFYTSLFENAGDLHDIPRRKSAGKRGFYIEKR